VKRLSFWSPLPLPARLHAALGEPIPVARAPGRGRDMALVAPLHALARERTQALYDALIDRREASAR